LLSASALSALAMLSFFCVWASPDMTRYFSAETYFISLATLYLVSFASAFMSSLALAYYSFPTKAPNHAMQLTQHFQNGWKAALVIYKVLDG
jgi:hypothetical protein